MMFSHGINLLTWQQVVFNGNYQQNFLMHVDFSRHLLKSIMLNVRAGSRKNFSLVERRWKFQRWKLQIVIISIMKFCAITTCINWKWHVSAIGITFTWFLRKHRNLSSSRLQGQSLWSVGGTSCLQVICSPKSVGLAFDNLFMYLLLVFLP